MQANSGCFMAEGLPEERYRMTAHGELRRIAAAFRINERVVGHNARIALATLADADNSFLDGNVYSSAVSLAPSRLIPYTGTRWQLRLNGEGSWSFLNQGQDQQMLSGSGNAVTLGREPAFGDVERFNTTRWLLYRDLTGFRLRPCMRVGGWLGVRDNRATLAGLEEPIGRWIYWSITPYVGDE